RAGARQPGVFPGGTSIGSSGVLPGAAPIELVLDVPGERAPSGCSAPALRLRCRCAYVGERVLANPRYPRRDEHWLVRRAAGDCAHRAGARRSQGGCSPGVSRTGATPPLAARMRRRAGARQPGVFPGGTSIGSSGVLPGTAPIELVLDVPGERAPSGCSAPALRLRCRCAYVGERVLANPLYSREGRAPARPVGLGRGFTRSPGLHQEVASTSTTRASGAWFLTDSMPLSREATL